jgi:hypothetical protein
MNKRSDCRRLRNRKLGMETLERRELLAAGVGCGTGAVVGPKCVGPAVVQQGDQIRDRDRLRDGSCQTTATVPATQTQTQQRDRLRDGSCQTT